MTQRERQILKWIEENPLISQQELADKAGIARSSVAVHISNLMKQGHIAGKGYIVRTAPYVVVVGGVNLDIGGRPHGELVAADSNPGQVRMSLGGVGRNIAHNMALMGLDVRMLTAFGDDMNAQRIAASCGELGIDISQCLTVPGGATSTYLFITDGTGTWPWRSATWRSMSMSPLPFWPGGPGCSKMPSSWWWTPTSRPSPSPGWQRISACPSSPTRCPPPRRRSCAPCWGSSTPSSPTGWRRSCSRACPSPTRRASTPRPTPCWPPACGGYSSAWGGDGVFAADHSGRVHVPCCPGEMVNTTGCGDAGMAAIAWAYLEGTGLEDTARAAMAAGAIAMESAETINPDMSARLLRQRAGFGEGVETP